MLDPPFSALFGKLVIDPLRLLSTVNAQAVQRANGDTIFAGRELRQINLAVRAQHAAIWPMNRAGWHSIVVVHGLNPL